MKSRTRSPRYPSLSLEEAVVTIKKIHDLERTNPVDRTVAAQALGYSGISGRSATVLGSLVQYGFLQSAGKSEVRVTPRAVEVLYPDSPRSRAAALRAAAEEPELFQSIVVRFEDGRPSENALRSYLVKEGFTNTAIPAAIKAYNETFEFLENEVEDERTSPAPSERLESSANQPLMESSTMQAPTQISRPSDATHLALTPGQGASIQFANKMIALGGVISTPDEADELIATLTALKPMLRKADAPAVRDGDEQDDEDELI